MDNIAQLGIKVDSSSIKQATNELSKLTNQSGKTEQSTKQLTTIFTKANITITAMATGLSYLVKEGIAYNATIEKLTNGLTTLNALTSSNVDNFGKQLSIQDKYNIASRESIETIAQLNKINLETPHTLNETVQIYKSMYSSMKNVGVSSEQMIDLTKKLSIAAGSSGIEFQQLLAGIDGLATGTVETGSELGRFLKSMGLGNEVLKQSTNIYETLNNKFKDVQGIIGYEEEISNLENSFDQLTGALVEPFFDDVKRGIHGLSSMFNDLTQSVTIFYDKFKSISELSTTDQLNKRAVEVTERIAEIQKDLANPSFFQSTGKLNAELRASNLELLSINDQFNKMNKLSEQKLVPTGIDRNESEIIKLAGSELSKFNLQLEDNVNKLKKVGATESEINKFRADQLKEFNEKQNKSLDEQKKKLEDTSKAYTEIAQIGMSQYDKSITSIVEQTSNWLKAGVNENDVLTAQSALLDEINRKTSTDTAIEELTFYERKIQLLDDTVEKEKELAAISYAKRVLEIENSDKTIKEKNRLIEKETELYNQFVKNMEVQQNSEFTSTMSDFYDGMIESQLELNSAVYDFGEGFDGVGTKISNITKSLASMNNLELKNKKEATSLDKKYIAQFNKYAGDIGKTAKLEQQYTKDTALLKEQNLQAQIAGYGQISGAMSKMFEEGSKEAAAFQMVESGLAVVAGIRAILTQGSGDPYSAFARMAVMAASVASLLSSADIAFGGIRGGGSTSTGKELTVNSGTGTVLGDVNAQSESMKKSLEILEEYKKPEFQVLQSMNKYLAGILDSLSGVSSLIVQRGGKAFGAGYVDNYTTKYNSIGVGINKFLNSTDIVQNIFGSDSTLANMDIGGKLVQKIVSGIFGKSSSWSELKGYGISFGSQLLKNAINEIFGSEYQTIKTTTKTSSWFKGTSETSKTKTKYYDMAGFTETERQFSLILDNMYNSVYEAGILLGENSDTLINNLDNFVVNLGNISFKGKSAAQIQTDLEAIFGAVGDRIAGSAIPILNEFQKVGEGMFTTLTRVATGMEVADYYAERLGTAFEVINFKAIENKQGDIGFEALFQTIEKYDEALYGVDNNLISIVENIDGTAEELYGVYSSLSYLRDMLKFMSINTDAISYATIRGAGSAEALSEAMGSYFENFLSESEQLQFKTQQLSKEFAELNMTMPTTKQGFTDLVKGLDISTESGQELYGRLILLNESFAEIIETADTKVENRTSLIDSLKDFVSSINSSLIKTTTFKDFSTSFNEMIEAIKIGSDDLTSIGSDTIASAQSYLDTVERTAKSSAEIEFAKKVISNKFEGVINAKDITLGTINDTLKISFNEDSVIVKVLNDVKNELVYLNQLNTRQTANSNKTLQLQRASIA